MFLRKDSRVPRQENLDTSRIAKMSGDQVFAKNLNQNAHYAQTENSFHLTIR